MTYLTNNGQLRSETDASIIENLTRKGWSIITQPAYDPLTQELQFDPADGKFNVVNLSEQIVNEAKLFNATAAGFLVEPENFTLGLQDTDRTAFTQMLSLVQEALALNIIDNNTPQIIADTEGIKHTVTTLRFRQIMVEYGMYYKSLWNQYSN